MRNALIVAAVLTLGVVGFFVFRGSSSSSDAKTRAAGGKERSVGERLSPNAPMRMRSSGEQPPTAKRYSGDGTTSAQPTRTYTRNDGSSVRDHRAAAPEPNLERHMTVPREISKIQPETLRAVRLALRPAMKDCLANHAADAEKGSKAQATLTVSVKDAELTVDKLHFASEGLPPEADEALRACATEAINGHTQSVPDVEDVKKHVMTFPYDL